MACITLHANPLHTTIDQELTVFYVAPDGEGTVCSKQQPCSLLSARKKVRQQNGEQMTHDIVVYLAGGVYKLDEPFKLSIKDAGKNGHTITWKPIQGQNPVFSGGVIINGWQKVEGKENRWSAPMPEGLTPRQLYVDGERAIRARGEGCTLGSECTWTSEGMKGPVAERLSQWKYPGDVEMVFRVRWRNYHCGVDEVDGNVVVMEQPCWLNSSTAKERMPYNWGSTTLDGDRYKGAVYFSNAPELLDEPGEFYVNSEQNRVYYIAEEGQNLATAKVVAPRTETLLSIQGTPDQRIKNLHIEGITFAYTAWQQPSTDDGYAGAQAGFTITGFEGPKDPGGEYFTYQVPAVLVQSAEQVVITQSVFKHLGGAGIVINDGSRYTSITHSKFYDISGGAIYVSDLEPDPAPDEVSIGNEVSWNTIKWVGLEFTGSVGIWGGYEVKINIDHNTIAHLPYTGITLGWGWRSDASVENVMHENRITNNRLVYLMKPAIGHHDGAAIYTQGVQPGTVIKGNYINRVHWPDPEPNALDGNGIYLDERSSYISVRRNVITRVGGKWVSNWAKIGIHNVATHNWSDKKSPALSGECSIKFNNFEGVEQLPPEAVSIARSAGANPPGEIEKLD